MQESLKMHLDVLHTFYEDKDNMVYVEKAKAKLFRT